MRGKIWSIYLTVAALTPALVVPVSAYKESGAKGGGSISGTIKFDGEAPALKKHSVNKDKKVCGKKPIHDEGLVVKDGGVQWAVVSLKGVESGKKWGAIKKAVMVQDGCRYKPHVTIMKVGEKLTVLNPDKILHNVHTHPGKTKNKVANVAQPRFKKKLRLSKRYFKKSGIMKVTCDVHNWMEGYIVVADNPYHVVSGEGGKFKISDVPAGSYTLKIWHQTLGTKSMKVEVKAGADSTVEATLKK